MNVGNIIVVLIIVAWLTLAIRHIINNKGTCSCGCNDCKNKKGTCPLCH